MQVSLGALHKNEQIIISLLVGGGYPQDIPYIDMEQLLHQWIVWMDEEEDDWYYTINYYSCSKEEDEEVLICNIHGEKSNSPESDNFETKIHHELQIDFSWYLLVGYLLYHFKELQQVHMWFVAFQLQQGVSQNLGKKNTTSHIFLHSLKLTANAPENRPKPKRKGSYSNHPSSGAKMLVSGRVH